MNEKLLTSQVKNTLSAAKKQSMQASKAETRVIVNFLREQLEQRESHRRFEEEFSLVGRGDLVSIDRYGHSTEYEIKRSKSDLMRELRFVETVQECRLAGSSRSQRLRELTYEGIPSNEMTRLVTRYCVDAETSKYLKHEWYLDSTRPTHENKRHKPNQFYFVVMLSHSSIAIRRITGSPYGLIVVDPSIDYFRLVKQADILHTDKINFSY